MVGPGVVGLLLRGGGGGGNLEPPPPAVGVVAPFVVDAGAEYSDVGGAGNEPPPPVALAGPTFLGGGVRIGTGGGAEGPPPAAVGEEGGSNETGGGLSSACVVGAATDGRCDAPAAPAPAFVGDVALGVGGSFGIAGRPAVAEVFELVGERIG